MPRLIAESCPITEEDYDKRVRRERDMAAYKRMYVEFLMLLFNDIMNKKTFQKALLRCLINDDDYYRHKLFRHFEAIEWLMTEARDSLCFQVLNLRLSQKDISQAILDKFTSPIKFNKFFTNYAKSINSEECYE